MPLEKQLIEKASGFNLLHHFSLVEFLENNFTTQTQPRLGPMSAVSGPSLSKPFLSAKLGEEVTLKTSTGLHIDFTLKSGC